MGLTMKSREMIRFLEHNGYRFIHAKGGSHHIYGNGEINIPITRSWQQGLCEDLIRMILRETGITKKELLEYLER